MPAEVRLPRRLACIVQVCATGPLHTCTVQVGARQQHIRGRSAHLAERVHISRLDTRSPGMQA